MIGRMRDPAGRGRHGSRALRGATAVVGALVSLALLAPAAHAFSITNLSATPANDNAGANSNFKISFGIQEPSAKLKDLVIHLPPGLVGNPRATPTCTEAKLKSDSCPAASKVGTIANDVKIGGLLPQTATGNVYNVVPRGGEPARFGFVLSAPPADKIVLQSPASLRQSDFGLDTTLRNLPQTATVAGLALPIDISAVDLSLQGKVGNPAKGFLRNPTSCGSHTVSVDATAYSSQTGSASTTFSTDRCNALPFSPKFSAEIDQTSTDLLDPVQLSTTISQTIEEAGLRKAVVTLPPEIIGNGQVLGTQCPAADFDAGDCSAETMVGGARAASPLQASALTGSVYLVQSTSPTAQLPDLGVDLQGALALKVKGSLSALPVTGGGLQIVVTFDGLPDIPLSAFTLTFDDGPRGLNLASRSPCKPPPFVFAADFTGHSGQNAAANASPKTSCPGGRADPTAKAVLRGLKRNDPRLSLGLHAGDAQLRSARVRLPKGIAVASRRKLARGTTISGGSLKGKGKKLKLRAKGGGVDLIRARLEDGAITVKRGLRRGDLGPVRISIRDADGKRTRLSLSFR